MIEIILMSIAWIAIASVLAYAIYKDIKKLYCTASKAWLSVLIRNVEQYMRKEDEGK